MQLNSKNRTGAKYIVEVLFDNSTISVLNKLTDRNVYAIKGIQVKYGDVILDHPCTPGLRSRWERKELTDCDDVTELSYETNSSLFELLSKSQDQNEYIRDIYFPQEGIECDAGDTQPDISIKVHAHCWQRVHDEYLSLFDVSRGLKHIVINKVKFKSTHNISK